MRSEERRVGKECGVERHTRYIGDWSSDVCSSDLDQQQVVALLKTWPGLRDLDVKRICKEDCEKWAAKFAEEYAASGYNHTISILKHAFERAIESGVRYEIGRASCRERVWS